MKGGTEGDELMYNSYVSNLKCVRIWDSFSWDPCFTLQRMYLLRLFCYNCSLPSWISTICYLSKPFYLLLRR